MVDKPWSKHPEYVALWVYCLLRGNFKECDVMTRTGSLVHLKAGQFIASRDQISEHTGIEKSKVERILNVFKSEQQIEQQNRGKFRIISILNWRKYQVSEQENEQQVNNTRTTGEQQVNTDKKVKKEKKKKEERAVADLLPICKAWKAYIEMRKKIRKDASPKAMEMAASKLIAMQKMGQDPVAILNQSIFNSWQGLFPVKAESKESHRQAEQTQTLDDLRAKGLLDDD